jgi:hypothetical protein
VVSGAPFRVARNVTTNEVPAGGHFSWLRAPEVTTKARVVFDA